jgi:hypothetical protein
MPCIVCLVFTCNQNTKCKIYCNCADLYDLYIICVPVLFCIYSSTQQLCICTLYSTVGSNKRPLCILYTCTVMYCRVQQTTNKSVPSWAHCACVDCRPCVTSCWSLRAPCTAGSPTPSSTLNRSAANRENPRRSSRHFARS